MDSKVRYILRRGDKKEFWNLVSSHYSSEFFTENMTPEDFYNPYSIIAQEVDDCFVVNEKSIGFVHLCTYRGNYDECSFDAALYPEYVGKGLMSKILPYVKHLALAFGYEYLKVCTSPKMEKSLYKLGFHFVDELPRNRIIMEMCLLQ